MPTIQRILCPIDFSEASDHAVEHALKVADWYGARVTALHVMPPRNVPSSALTPPYAAAPMNDDERHQIEGLVAARFSHAVRPDCVDTVVEDGAPANVILDHASRDIDLVVIGTHGTSGFDRLVLGSVAEKVLRKARCPVMTVPPRALLTSQLPYKRILTAVDFSDASLPGVEFSLSVAQEANAALTLMHVIEWPWDEPPPPDFDKMPTDQASALSEFRFRRERETRHRLEALVPSAARDWCSTHARVAHGKAWRELLRVADDEQADLIVIGVHGRPSINLAFFGSTTNQVVRRATCPVLTIRHR